MQVKVKQMVEKLSHMPQDRLAEINDFIDFVQQRDQNLRLHHDFSKASEASFSEIWDNDDDAAYDLL